MFESSLTHPAGDAAAAVSGVPGPPTGEEPNRGELASLIDRLERWDTAEDQVEAVDRIRVLEELKAACAAAQAREAAALFELRCAAEAQEDIPPKERGRGVAAEIALARRESPARGSRHLGLARTLVADLPNTMAALSQGRISEWTATTVCREVICLSSEDRRAVDAGIADRLGVVGQRRLLGAVRRQVQLVDADAVVARRHREMAQRRVSVRPAPGDMAYLTALLPLHQAVGVFATLTRDAATTVGAGDDAERTQGQIMADLLVERTTGQQAASAVPAEVQLVMTDRALLGGADVPAWVIGHGPVPAAVARTWLRGEASEVFLRRLYAEPATGQLVGMESRRRVFPESLRRMIIVRDDLCRTPYCDAQIKHLDHAVPVTEGGETTWANGSGLCIRCNQTKEIPGWSHRADPRRLVVTTPTGHRYDHRTPPLPVLDPPGGAAGVDDAEVRSWGGADPPGDRAKEPVAG